MIVYIATNRSNGKIYVGQTVNSLNRRKNNHISRSNSGCPLYFHNALRKYGVEGFKWDIIRICDNIESLNAFEQHYILYYDSINSGYNLQSGGLNSRHSKETCKKMSKAKSGKNHPMYGKQSPNFGKKLSRETRKKISDNHSDVSGKNNPNYGKRASESAKEKNRIAHLGKKLSEATKKKISESRKGIKFSDEHKKNLSEAGKKYWNNIRNNK